MILVRSTKWEIVSPFRKQCQELLICIIQRFLALLQRCDAARRDSVQELVAGLALDIMKESLDVSYDNLWIPGCYVLAVGDFRAASSIGRCNFDEDDLLRRRARCVVSFGGRRKQS